MPPRGMGGGLTLTPVTIAFPTVGEDTNKKWNRWWRVCAGAGVAEGTGPGRGDLANLAWHDTCLPCHTDTGMLLATCTTRASVLACAMLGKQVLGQCQLDTWHTGCTPAHAGPSWEGSRPRVALCMGHSGVAPGIYSHICNAWEGQKVPMLQKVYIATLAFNQAIASVTNWPHARGSR